MSTRTYTSRRANLLKAIAEKLKDIDASIRVLGSLCLSAKRVPLDASKT